MKRSRIAPMSPKRREAIGERAVIRARVLARDQVCQLAAAGAGRYAVPACHGGPTPHHRRKASAGGGYTMANLVMLCSGCNCALEADADLARWAHSVGLVVKRGDPEWADLG